MILLCSIDPLLGIGTHCVCHPVTTNYDRHDDLQHDQFAACSSFASAANMQGWPLPYYTLHRCVFPEVPPLYGQAFLIIKDPAPIGFVGNRTECALLMLLRTWDADYTVIREKYASMVEKVWDFDSAKKMASVLVRTPDGYRLYNKARTPIASCSFFHDLCMHDPNSWQLHYLSVCRLHHRMPCLASLTWSLTWPLPNAFCVNTLSHSDTLHGSASA